MAYIPSLRVLKEGGYEGGGAMVYYGQPAIWSDEVEEAIVAELARQSADGASGGGSLRLFRLPKSSSTTKLDEPRSVASDARSPDDEPDDHAQHRRKTHHE